ncbi:hypothetical protein Golomagni_05856 [Golovinomyces magnicellulatus]|nr:hypothetical protein Golomagni_05856 [Golovinomyces magnicellulatus]
MATPTPMKHAPSQQGRTPSGRTPSHLAAGATPPVSTPFSNAAQAAFSPRNQRSSPQHVKKSPATSMMGHSSMGALNFDSPSTAAAMGALGSFDIGLDGVAGLDGLTSAFASEEEKLRRLDTILKLLNEKKGLVSEAGIERLAQRLGMELLAEEHGTPGGRKTKTLAIAGSEIALDIVLDNNVVQNATLSYHGSAESVSKHIDAAGEILLKDLQLLPNQSPLTKTLDKFASNFEHIAKLDKLSISPGLDCHEALAGIYQTFERLHDWDMEQLRKDPQLAGKSDAFLSQTAMCSKHGNPVMHARGKVGLALQYWKQLRLTPPPSVTQQPADATQDDIWSLVLGCAAIDQVNLPPVRVSDNWISKDVIKADSDSKNPILDWQEPDQVSLPQSEETKDAGMEVLQPDLSTTRVPRVMFTVSFDPPVILPQNDWARLYAFANVEPPPINPPTDFSSGRAPPSPPTFDALFFPITSGTRQDPSEPRSITRNRNVTVFNAQQNRSVQHHSNTLYIYKPIYSQEVSEMPFSHPKQLIEMLPLLRQYSFLTTLLRNSFPSTSSPSESDHTATVKDKQPQLQTQPQALQQQQKQQQNANTVPLKDQLTGFATQDSTPASSPDNAISMDVILWVHPSPHMQIVFPLGSSTAEVMLRILEGGTVEVTSENILEQLSQEKKSKVTKESLAKVLEHLEDLSKWTEWIRTRLV